MELEATGHYVFHGSGAIADSLEPRQAHNYIDGIQHPDGDPAVFASSLADYAIFMGIINKKNCPEGYHSSAGTETKNGKMSLKFRAGDKTLAQLGDSATGFVFVFGRKLFAQRDRGGIEHAAYQPVKPVEIIKVSKGDMPSEIDVFKE